MVALRLARAALRPVRLDDIAYRRVMVLHQQRYLIYRDIMNYVHKDDVDASLVWQNAYLIVFHVCDVGPGILLHYL